VSEGTQAQPVFPQKMGLCPALYLYVMGGSVRMLLKIFKVTRGSYLNQIKSYKKGLNL